MEAHRQQELTAIPHGRTVCGAILADTAWIRRHLAAARTIAVVGLSPKPDRDSHRVAAYMKSHGYRIIPVRPAQNAILGERAYASLQDIDEPVDIVNVFRSSDQVPAIAAHALALRPKLFWMQEGIENPEAARRLNDAGIDVVMDRCIMVDHESIRKK